MFNLIVNSLKKNLPRPVYNLIKIPYSIFFINPKYTFGPIGFFQKTKLDIYELFNIKNFFVKYDKFQFHNKGWKMLLEKNGFDKLNHLENILDLGGYIGDSPIELCIYHNKKIHVFEPEQEKFKWLLKNIHLNKLQNKIIPYNYAVISGNQEYLEIKKNGNFCGASSFSNDPTLKEIETVRCMNIKEIMKLADFDGFKCDIEGGEFQIIDYFLENPKKFTFNKGIIEWHFFKKDNPQKDTLLKFLKFLKNSNYNFHFYPQNKPKTLLNTKEELSKIFNNSALKYPYTNMFYFWKN
ncbi:FkbM family methyltransferase [Candidatus Pacearchaeota archaeon]|nr:FkbM family methyltransferase [Candidatus Pacearchaeota archaeon]